jgi:hypothetical protein
MIPCTGIGQGLGGVDDRDGKSSEAFLKIVLSRFPTHRLCSFLDDR